MRPCWIFIITVVLCLSNTACPIKTTDNSQDDGASASEGSGQDQPEEVRDDDDDDNKTDDNDSDDDNQGNVYTCADEILPPMTQPEILGKYFLVETMTTPEGGIWSNLKDTWPLEAGYGVNHDLLSESAGLALMYAAYARDKALFDRYLAFVRDYLKTDDGLLIWRINLELGEEETSSASIDDLRVVKGLLLGYECWREDGIRSLALQIANGVKTYNFHDWILIWGSYWDDGFVGVDNTPEKILSYIDTEAMQLLTGHDASWDPILQDNVSFLSQGLIEPGNPLNGLFEDTYEGGQYQHDPNELASMIRGMHTALWLARGGRTDLAQRSLNMVKKEFNETHHISHKYHWDGSPEGGAQDMAVYGIIARLAYALNDVSFAEAILEKMSGIQITEAGHPYYGAFTWEEDDIADQRVYIFSHLNALVVFAYQRYLNRIIPQ